MNVKFSLCLLILAVSCTIKNAPKKNEVIATIDKPVAKKVQGIEVELEDEVTPVISFQDSIRAVVIDTSTLEGKRDYLLQAYYLENPTGFNGDTLMDLNFDSKKDFVIKTYVSGTGISNSQIVYLYDQKRQGYKTDTVLSGLINPSYYLENKKVTSFYLSNAGGFGSELSWVDNGWTLIKTFSVTNHARSSVWAIDYPLNAKHEELRTPYQRVPPIEVLKTKYESYE